MKNKYILVLVVIIVIVICFYFSNLFIKIKNENDCITKEINLKNSCVYINKCIYGITYDKQIYYIGVQKDFDSTNTSIIYQLDNLIYYQKDNEIIIYTISNPYTPKNTTFNSIKIIKINNLEYRNLLDSTQIHNSCYKLF